MRTATEEFPDSVQIAWLRRPDAGAVTIQRCPECKRIEIIHSIYASPPKEGDAYLFTWPCLRCFRIERIEMPQNFGPYALGLTSA
ncbi:MAG: hypothetical protein ACRDQZ_10335 [Mycobacteriales bacterium]